MTLKNLKFVLILKIFIKTETLLMKMLCFYSVLHNQVVFVYNSEVFMRFGVLMAVTDDCFLLGCDAV